MKNLILRAGEYGCFDLVDGDDTNGHPGIIATVYGAPDARAIAARFAATDELLTALIAYVENSPALHPEKPAARAAIAKAMGS